MTAKRSTFRPSTSAVTLVLSSRPTSNCSSSSLKPLSLRWGSNSSGTCTHLPDRETSGRNLPALMAVMTLTSSLRLPARASRGKMDEAIKTFWTWRGVFVVVWFCFCGGVFVVLLVWWCFCGVFLWWCGGVWWWSSGVLVVVFWCFCGGVVCLWWRFCGGVLVVFVGGVLLFLVVVFLWWCGMSSAGVVFSGGWWCVFCVFVLVVWWCFCDVFVVACGGVVVVVKTKHQVEELWKFQPTTRSLFSSVGRACASQAHGHGLDPHRRLWCCAAVLYFLLVCFSFLVFWWWCVVLWWWCVVWLCFFALCGAFCVRRCFCDSQARMGGAFFVCCGGVFVVVVFSAPAQCSCRPWIGSHLISQGRKPQKLRKSALPGVCRAFSISLQGTAWAAHSVGRSKFTLLPQCWSSDTHDVAKRFDLPLCHSFEHLTCT